MPTLIRWTLSVWAREGSLKGTVIRSAESCAKARPPASTGRIKIKFCIVVLLLGPALGPLLGSGAVFLLLTLPDANVSVEGVELEFGPSTTHPHAVKRVALINKLAIALFADRRAAGQRR